MKDRLSRFLKEENISPAKFADILGVQRSSISHYLSGRNNPSLDFIQKILVRFKYISPEWLLLGKGEMYKRDFADILHTTTIDSSGKNSETEASSELNFAGAMIDEEEIFKPEEPKQTNLHTQASENQKAIDKIVVFYTDHTFQEFPAK